MKPLIHTNITNFLERFDNFQDSEIRSLNIISPNEIELTLTAQDKARAYDWVTVKFLFLGIDDARLIDENKLTYVTIEDGITILYENGFFAFALGNIKSVSSAKDSQLYLISDTIKYSESQF